MKLRERVARLDLAAVLLLVTVLELALNRLAVPTLRPPGHLQPPTWHEAIDQGGLFIFHFASVLGIAVVAWQTWLLAARERIFSPPAQAALAGTTAVFLGLAVWGVAAPGARMVTFPLESAFVAFVNVLLITSLLAPGDLRAKLGLLLLCAPFFIHYYGTFVLRLFTPGDMASWSSLPDRVREIGNWSVAACALVSPLVFAPGPPRRALGRAVPMTIAAFAATLAAIILRRHYDVGMLIAARGLGIHLGPSAPLLHVVVYVLALSAAAWTLTATLTSTSGARRALGGGYALVVVSGYAFAWPLQLTTVAAGLLLVVQGIGLVQTDEAQERTTHRGRFHAPPIVIEAWSAFTTALAAALQAAPPALRREAEGEETIIAGTRQGLPFQLKLDRTAGALISVELTFGELPPVDVDPSWTLLARPEGALAVGTHPAPPRSRAPQFKTGDEPFDRRFRVHDADRLTARIFDDARRSSATALLDGWVAIWPGKSLRYRVFPGRGAPLDHPIPVTELAFRGVLGPKATEKMTLVFELLAALATRVLGEDQLAAESSSRDSKV